MFAELKDLVREKIQKYELTRTIDPGHFYPTIESAVEAFAQSAQDGNSRRPPLEKTD